MELNLNPINSLRIQTYSKTMTDMFQIIQELAA